MKQIFNFSAMLLLVLAVFGPAAPFTSAETTTYVSDSFSRAVSNGWGSADSGGAYALVGKADGFGVNGSSGTIVLGAKKNRSAYLPAVAVLDSTSSVKVKTDKLGSNGAQFVYLLARRSATGDGYLGRLRLPAEGTVRLRAATRLGSQIAVLGSEVTVANLKHVAGQFIYLRMQVKGSNPATIKLRAWGEGQAEPTGWQYSVTDSTAALQQAGAVGLVVGSAAQATNRPFVFTFDDYAVTDPVSNTSNAHPIYWGALVGGKAPSVGNLAVGGIFDDFESRARKKMAIIHWGQPWQMNHAYLSFQTEYFDDVRNHGAIPLLDWGSFNLGSGVKQTNFQLKDITNGAYDSYIAQWAQDAKAWGHPLFLRFDWEMNGDWQFPWSEKLNGNQPGDYVKMWRHVHNIFTQNGVSNVTWVWCPNIASDKTTPMASLYPGDAFVDWTCLDGYNKYSTWLKFDQLFAAKGINWLNNSYGEITKLAPNKPLMIGEVASLEAGDGGAKKAAWIKDAFLTQLPKSFPKIQAVVWFDWDDGNPASTFPVDSSQASADAFAQGIGSNYYATNDFAGLDTSPIPPLK